MTSARRAARTESAVAAALQLTILLGIFFLIVGAALLFPAQPKDAESSPTAPQLAATCTAEPESLRQECYLGALEPLLSSDGIASTFAVLLEITKIDPFAAREAHALAHELGRRAYTVTLDAGTAMAECPHALASGCSHGVMEAHLTAVGIHNEADIAAICDGFENGFAWFQCLHGLGHGLTMYLNHNLADALRYCDALSTRWSQESCYGGVFMENIVSYTLSLEQSGSAGPHAHHGMRTHGVLFAADPHYPCTIVDERYLRSCYLLQSSGFLTLNGYDFVDAFRQCSSASEPYDEICYQSLGRDVSAHVAQEPARIVELCRVADAKSATWCLFGAVKDIINTAGSPESGFALCQAVDAEFKPLCYQGIGEMIQVLFPEPERRAEACLPSETDYVGTCQQHAGLP